MAKQKFRKTKIILGCIYVLILAFYAVFLFQVYSANQTGSPVTLFGGRYLPLNDSNGSLVVIKEQEEYKKGDTVLYSLDGNYKVGDIDSIILQNDVKIATIISGTEQEYISYNQIIGVVASQVSHLGTAFNFMQSTTGIIIILFVPSGTFLIYNVIMIIRRTRKGKTIYEYSGEFDDNEHWEPKGLEIPEEEYTAKIPEAHANSEKPQNYGRGKESKKTMSAPVKLENSIDDILSEVKNKMDFKDTHDISNRFEAALGEKVQGTGHDNELKKFMSAPAKLNNNFDDILSELRYKMDFQDTRQLSKRFETILDEYEQEVQQNLNSYGIQTSVIEDGIEIIIDRIKTKDLVLQLKNDGSLCIITENYQAEITSDITSAGMSPSS